MASMTATVTRAITTTITITSASASSTSRATPQGGILEGANPVVWDSKNPIILFIIQAGIIIIFCRLLHYPLSLIRQPRVIAEVIGGIILGPSVFGRIPGFTNAIFPASSIPSLSLVANLGLVLFLFLVGLEVDLRFVASNAIPALSVGAAGMALPFGLGCAIAWGLYNQFNDETGTVPIAFGTYMLFVGVAMAITAFPVLCRILTELKLLSTPVGIIVLSAGVSNDIMGWILLALCVALVNAGSGLTALWVLLAAVGYALFLAFAVRPAFLWFLRRTNSIQEGPSQGVVVLTLMIALASAFFTGVIGVHPIFGAFMAGLICPHEGGFAIKLTEKIEDLISALFLPLYFALSGLSTNLGLLDSGIVWAYVIAVIAVAFFAKLAGGTIAARLNGLVWRESLTIGVLMSCKGLVELIVLNIGLQAKILSTRTFTIFVVMALVTTFATTPLTSLLYPPWYQRKLDAWKRGEIDWDTGRLIPSDHGIDAITMEKLQSRKVNSVLAYLRLDNMPTLMALVSLLGNRPVEEDEKVHPSHRLEDSTTTSTRSSQRAPVQVHGIRLLELTERSSSVMQVSEVDEYTAFDPVINAFKVLGQLYNLAVSGEATVVPVNSYADVLVHKAADESSDLLLIPWSETGAMTEAQTISSDSVNNKLESDSYTSFVTAAFAQATCNIAIFVNQGFSGSLKQRPSTLNRAISHMSARRQAEPAPPNTDRSHHIFVPFFGGNDDRAALRLAMQLAENPEVTATFVHYASSTNDEVVHQQHAVTSKASSAASLDAASDEAFFITIQKSLPAEYASRVIFGTAEDSSMDAAVTRAQAECAYNPKNGGNLVVLGRATGGIQAQSCLGSTAQKLVNSNIKASLLVVQGTTVV